MDLISADFWSSTEYAGFGRALAEELTRRGIAAAARFEIPQKRYWAARGRVARWRLRAAAYGVYPWRLARAVRRAPVGRVAVVCTNTFYAPAVALASAGGRTPVVHWVLDLFPDVLTVAGGLRLGGRAERLLRRVVRRTFERAAANVFLGPRLLAYAAARFGPVPRAVVIPVGADGASFHGHEPEGRSGSVRVLYCGNFGRMHEVATVADALEPGAPAGIEIAFRGNGAGFRELAAARTGAAGVSFGDNLPEPSWVPAMLGADVALVTLRSGAEGLVMPSKTYSAMVAGQAILAVCPEVSDLADTVRRHACGWVVPPGDPAALRATLAAIAVAPEEVLRRRKAAYAAGHRFYDQSVLADEWEKVLVRAGRDVGGNR